MAVHEGPGVVVGGQVAAHWLSWTCSMSPGVAREKRFDLQACVAALFGLRREELEVGQPVAA